MSSNSSKINPINTKYYPSLHYKYTNLLVIFEFFPELHYPLKENQNYNYELTFTQKRITLQSLKTTHVSVYLPPLFFISESWSAIDWLYFSRDETLIRRASWARNIETKGAWELWFRLKSSYNSVFHKEVSGTSKNWKNSELEGIGVKVKRRTQLTQHWTGINKND